MTWNPDPRGDPSAWSDSSSEAPDSAAVRPRWSMQGPTPSLSERVRITVAPAASSRARTRTATSQAMPPRNSRRPSRRRRCCTPSRSRRHRPFERCHGHAKRCRRCGPGRPRSRRPPARSAGQRARAQERLGRAPAVVRVLGLAGMSTAGPTPKATAIVVVQPTSSALARGGDLDRPVPSTGRDVPDRTPGGGSAQQGCAGRPGDKGTAAHGPTQAHAAQRQPPRLRRRRRGTVRAAATTAAATPARRASTCTSLPVANVCTATRAASSATGRNAAMRWTIGVARTRSGIDSPASLSA